MMYATALSTTPSFTRTSPLSLIPSEAFSRCDDRPYVPAMEIEPIFTEPLVTDTHVKFGDGFTSSQLHRTRDGLAVNMSFLHSNLASDRDAMRFNQRLCQVRLFSGYLTTDGVVRVHGFSGPETIQVLFDVDDICTTLYEMAALSAFTTESGECPDMDEADFHEYKQWTSMMTFIRDLPRMQYDAFDTIWMSATHMLYWSRHFNNDLLKYFGEQMMASVGPAND